MLGSSLVELPQGRKRRRQSDHTSLPKKQVLRSGAALGRPKVRLEHRAADTLPIVGVAIGPDMDQMPDVLIFAVPDADQGRELHPPLDRRRPTLDDAFERAFPVSIEAKLVDPAKLPFNDWRGERRGFQDQRPTIDDDLADIRRPIPQGRRLPLDARTVLDTLIGPDLDNLVQRAGVASPQTAERRKQLSCRKSALER